jgi:hypothetical protein
MEAMPIASDGNGENENYDYDQANILQPLVRWRRAARILVLAGVKCFEHGAIVIDLMLTTRRDCAERLYPLAGCWPFLRVCRCRQRGEIRHSPQPTCALDSAYSGSADVWLRWPWQWTNPNWMRISNCEWGRCLCGLQFEYPSRSVARSQPVVQTRPPNWP